MRQLNLLIIFVSILAVVGCNSPSETDHVSRAEDSLQQAPVENLDNYSEAFKSIVKTSDGILRGVSFGMSLPEVKKVEEKTQLDEEQSNHLDYMVDFAELEEAEVNYYFNEYSRVNSIELNIYPKSKGSQDSIFAEFEKYFNKKYGQSTSKEDNPKKWEYKKDNIFILMERKDTHKVHDIIIRFSSLTKEMASALYESDSVRSR